MFLQFFHKSLDIPRIRDQYIFYTCIEHEHAVHRKRKDVIHRYGGNDDIVRHWHSYMA